MRRVNQAAGAAATKGDRPMRAGTGSALLAAILAGCGGLASDPSAEGMHAPLDPSVYSYSESFEQGFGGWLTDHALPCEPECGLLDWSINHSSLEAADGAFALRGYLNGNHDAGTMWIERGFSIHPPARARYRVTLSFHVWSDVASRADSSHVVAYIGYENPERASDFTIVGQTNQVAGWKSYSLVRTVSFDETQALQVALGIDATAPVRRRHFIDLVSLKVE
jgi:hypothetical protein